MALPHIPSHHCGQVSGYRGYDDIRRCFQGIEWIALRLCKRLTLQVDPMYIQFMFFSSGHRYGQQLQQQTSQLSTQLRWLFRWEVYDRVKLHAQALTYDTLLALVPLLAVVLAIVNGFGGTGTMAQTLEDIIFDNISGSPELKTFLSVHLRQFVAQIHNSNQSGLSILLLIFSVLSLLSHIEFSFNMIFGSPGRRPLVRRFILYWSILSLSPFFCGALLAGVTYLQYFVPSLAHIPAVLMTLPVTWVGFASLYVLVPQIPVRWSAGLIGGICMGTLWQIAKQAFSFYTQHTVTLQNIYGSLAAIPLFILWIYLSWLLVLFGAQLTFALQHGTNSVMAALGDNTSPQAKEIALLRMYLAIADDFQHHQGPTSRSKLAQRFSLPPSLVAEVVHFLCEHHYVVQTIDNEGLVPGQPLENMKLETILQHWRQQGSHLLPRQDPTTAWIIATLQQDHSSSDPTSVSQRVAQLHTLANTPPLLVQGEQPK